VDVNAYHRFQVRVGYVHRISFLFLFRVSKIMAGLKYSNQLPVLVFVKGGLVDGTLEQ
jgi:hypothetical protein